MPFSFQSADTHTDPDTTHRVTVRVASHHTSLTAGMGKWII